MSVANWKTEYSPSKTGDYIATVRGKKIAEIVRFNKGVCVDGGNWVEDVFGYWQPVDVIAWDDLPEAYQHDV